MKEEVLIKIITLTLISLLVSIQSFAEEKISILPLDNGFLSFNCKTEKHEKLYINLTKKGRASISESDSNVSLFNSLNGSWREQEQGVIRINVSGLPTKTLEDQYSALAILEISPLGSFAFGSYESGTYEYGFEKMKLECLVR